jgi:hypothetical protein
LRLLIGQHCKAQASADDRFALRLCNHLAAAQQRAAQAKGCTCRKNPAPARLHKERSAAHAVHGCASGRPREGSNFPRHSPDRRGEP